MLPADVQKKKKANSDLGYSCLLINYSWDNIATESAIRINNKLHVCSQQ